MGDFLVLGIDGANIGGDQEDEDDVGNEQEKH